MLIVNQLMNVASRKAARIGHVDNHDMEDSVGHNDMKVIMLNSSLYGMHARLASTRMLDILATVILHFIHANHRHKGIQYGITNAISHAPLEQRIRRYIGISNV